MNLPDFGLAGGAVADFGAAAGDLITQQGYYRAAQGYTQAGNIESQNETIARSSGAIQKAQAARELYKSESSTEAAAGGAGLKLSGSMASVIRGSAAQGALQQAVIGANTETTVNNSKAQATAYYAESDQATAQGNAAGAASGSSMLGGIVSGIGSIAAMAML